jgi:hypothetical protein
MISFSVVNVQFPTRDKDGEVKVSFCGEELEHEFDQSCKCHLKTLLGDFSAADGQESILKPTIGNKSLLKIGTVI